MVDNGPQHAAMASLETLQCLKLEIKEKDDRLKQMVSMEKRMLELEAKVSESQDVDRYIKGEAPYTVIGLIVMPGALAIISGARDWKWIFTTHLNGYQLCFSVPKYTGHFSIACESMAGAHDDNLQWPIGIHLVIRLLNQLQNSGHAEFHVRMDRVYRVKQLTEYGQRVTQPEHVRSVVVERHLTFAELEYDEKRNTQYLKGDTLKFQIEILKLS